MACMSKSASCLRLMLSFSGRAPALVVRPSQRDPSSSGHRKCSCPTSVPLATPSPRPPRLLHSRIAPPSSPYPSVQQQRSLSLSLSKHCGALSSYSFPIRSPPPIQRLFIYAYICVLLRYRYYQCLFPLIVTDTLPRQSLAVSTPRGSAVR